MLTLSNKKDVKRVSTGKSALIILSILAIGAFILDCLGICWTCK